MKKLMLAALASTLLGGCAHEPSASRESRARSDDYVVGSRLPRKNGPSASKASTASAADVEEAKMQ